MIRFFSKHPTAANLLMVIFLVMGVMSLPRLKRETFPEQPLLEIEVRVVYPGATAIDIEDAICRRLEDAIDGLTGIEEVRAEALEGLGRVVVEAVEGADIAAVLDDVRSEVDAIDNFPDDAESPVVTLLGKTDPVCSIAVVGDMPPAHLKASCQNLKDELQRLDAISLVEIEGFSEHQLRVELPSSKLLQLGLSVQAIADVVGAQSLDLPSGNLEGWQRDVLVRFTDERRTVAELEDLIVVGSASGAEIRLGDIARVRDVFEKEEEKFLFDGQRAGLLKISKTRDQDALVVVETVKAFIADQAEHGPPGLELQLTQDLSSPVRDRLQMLIKNGWQGLILVFLSMWLFFNLRLSFWVAMGLPVSFLGGFYLMTQVGYSLNMLTMVSLLLALGLLMDDAIVLAENVASHLQKGKSALRAAIDGVAEVKAGVISSFLTTVAVFGPISFMTGKIGHILKVLPVVLIGVLAVSLVEAFLILPSHLAHSMHGVDIRKKNWLRKRFERFLEWLRESVVGGLVDRTVRHRVLCLGVVILIFFVSVGGIAGGLVQFEAFPDVEGDVVVARLLLPQGTPLVRTEQLVAQLLSGLEVVEAELGAQQPGGRLILQTSVQFAVNKDANESGPHVATVTADLLPGDQRDAGLDDVLNGWRAAVGELPDVLALNYTEPALGPTGNPIELRLQGAELEELKATAGELQAWFAQFKGVFDLSDDLRPGKPELRVRLQEGAYSLGLNARQVASQLRAALLGQQVSEIQIGPETYEVEVRVALEDRNSAADLEGFYVTLPDGAQIPLESVARIERGRGYARIGRVDGQRTVTLIGNADPAQVNVSELIRTFQSTMLPELQERLPGLEVLVEGETSEGNKTSSSMLQGFLLGLIGVFTLLSFQFRSYLEPLVVMTAIPLCLVGVIWGHFLLGLNLTLPSMVGFVSLSGVVVNDSILLVEFIKIHRRQGMPVAQAARMASRARFRAVLLTSLTTVAGMAPLLTETSMQAQILIPLAASIVFGLSTSTLLVLFVVPASYAFLADLGLTREEEEHEEEEAGEAASAETPAPADPL